MLLRLKGFIVFVLVFTVPSLSWAVGIDGKGLICKCEGCGSLDPIDQIQGWSFVDGAVARSYFIIYQDKVRIQKKAPWRYKSDEKWIEWDVAGTTFKLSRSTLNLYGIWGQNEPSQCSVYQSLDNFHAELSKIQGDLQFRYNKKLVGNKI